MMKPNSPTPPAAPASGDGSSSLLAFTVKAFFLLALIVPAAVYLIALQRQNDFAPYDHKRNTQYYSARLLAALRTFESGILPVQSPSPADPWTDQTLFTGVPGCQKDWDDLPGGFARGWNETRNRILFWIPPQKLHAETTAQRMAAQLNVVDAYLAEVGKANDGRAAGPVVLNRTRWFETVAIALATPISPSQRDNDKLWVQCSDMRDALRTLVPNACRQAWEAVHKNGASDKRLEQAQKSCDALGKLSWRGTTLPRQAAGWNPEQVVHVPRSLVTQRDPWQGVAGCIYWNDSPNAGGRYYLADAEGNPNRLCESAEVAGLPAQATPGPKRLTVSPVSSRLDAKTPLNDPRWSVPPSLSVILRPLDTLRQPGGVLYQKLTEDESDSSNSPGHYRFGPNQITLGGAKQEIGFSVDLTLNAHTQALAQQVAACYTGVQEVCQALQLTRAEDSKGKDGQSQPIGHQLLENAMVRLAGIVIMDIASGQIEAVAGALSPCTRQDYDGPRRDSKKCDDRLPWPPVFRPDALENPALFLDAMPASTIKPIMAAAFLSDGDYGQRLLAAETAGARKNMADVEQEIVAAQQQLEEAQQQAAASQQAYEIVQQEKSTAQKTMRIAVAKRKAEADQRKVEAAQKKLANAQTSNVPLTTHLRRQLAKSDSAGFLDRMFCAERGFTSCQRPWAVQAMARVFGWNAACDPPTAFCGKQDVLFGRAPDQFAENGLVIPLGHLIPFGRLLTQPDNSLGRGYFRLIPQPKMPMDSATLKACAQGSDKKPQSDDDWEKCPIGIVAEGWGQGNGRASVVGVAGIMAMLGAAANGNKEFSPPFLVADIRGVGDSSQASLKLALQRYEFSRSRPITLKTEIAQVILGGLQYSHRSGTAQKACNEVFGAKVCASIDWIAGKTGTPTFNKDQQTLATIAKQCKTNMAQAKPIPGCSELRPYKWYTAVFRSSAKKTQWDKAIAVLTERNWVRSSGKVHGAGDHGPNPSAEIALQIVGRLRGDISK